MGDFSIIYQQYQEKIEKKLEATMPLLQREDGGYVSEAARYSLLAGGKRIRPVLTLAVADMLQLKQPYCDTLATAVEMIHTYSLIHDDLPALDNDDLRRGQATNHKKFGEAIAILAGDALLNQAFEILICDLPVGDAGAKEAFRVISQASGLKGMIAGQTLDLTLSNTAVDMTLLKKIQAQKTGALLLAAIIAPAKLGCLDQEVIKKLTRFGEALGFAFQVKDDILDVTASSQMLGKSVGKDKRDKKITAVTFLGIEKAEQLLQEQHQIALKELQDLEALGYNSCFLQDLTQFLLKRSY